jgi:hypothetical protein
MWVVMGALELRLLFLGLLLLTVAAAEAVLIRREELVVSAGVEMVEQLLLAQLLEVQTQAEAVVDCGLRVLRQQAAPVLSLSDTQALTLI